MRRLVPFLLALLAWLTAGPASAGEMRLRVVTTDFLLPGKFERMAALDPRVAVEALWIETAQDPPAAWLDADLVILDTPRPVDLGRVQQRLGAALAATATPWLRVGAGPPDFGNLPAEHARRLAAYYDHGGPVNLRHMLDYLRLWRAGGDVGAVPPPAPMPPTGLYHPAADGPFASVEAYLAWGAGRWPEAAPRVAFAIYPGAVSNMQTQVLDAVVAAAEARGVLPLMLWFDAAAPDGLRRMLGPAAADVLVNMQHMQNGPARQAEFLEVNLPVLQTTGYREGSAAQWAADPSGISGRTAAVTLAVPEGWGMSDPMVVSAVRDGEPEPLPRQIDALLAKAERLARLRHLPAADKRLALMFWNYPAGAGNFSASHLNVPRSLEGVVAALAAAGHAVTPASEAELIAAGQAMLGAVHHPERLEALLAQGLAEALPLEDYESWLAGLAEGPRRALLDHWGQPEDHWALREVDGRFQFVIPRLRLGNLVVMPQLPRAGAPGAHYHDGRHPPDHLYLAAYLYLREGFRADALIHFGTHGTQEWTPGKDRGLSVDDFPFLAVGDLPVFYPYIQDNVAEAVQAKRRGRAVVISHQTPPFAPAGLYDELRDIHALIHDYEQLDEGAVRQDMADRIAAAAVAAGLHADLGWDAEAVSADFPGFYDPLHDHLHELAAHVMPLGLHSFGQPAAPEHRLATVMQQLGTPFYEALGLDAEELFAEDFSMLQDSPPYRVLQRHLREGVAIEAVEDETLRALLRRAAALDRHLAEPGEIEALLNALAGGFVAPGPGGDPIRNPDVPSGRNLHAFEPSKVPSPAAYDAGGEALRLLVEAHRAAHDGRAPEKLAFSLWASETIRQLGVVEAQVLHALGLRPVWDGGGRVTALEPLPATGRDLPPMDVVVQVTSVYRDQFDGFMRLLAEAIDDLAVNAPDSPLARNSAALAQTLTARGIAPERAAALSRLRLFSNEPGEYGTGLGHATLDSTAWEDEAPLAEQFLSRLQYAYGASDWGLRLDEANLFAEQLKGVEAAVLSRSSRLHGLLSTDHPFEYLGGLSLVVRHLSGASPALYVADLRDARPRVGTAAAMLAAELRARPLNPHWIKGLQAEGYAGTLEMLNTVNNLWGWQVTDPATVRPDQWQAVHDTYVRDSRGLGLAEWFAAHNPTAQAQLIERLVEAVRKGYWAADARTLRELAERWAELADNHGVQAGSAVARAFIADVGFGTDAAAADAPIEQVSGQELVPAAAVAAPADWRPWLAFALLAVAMLAGAGLQWRGNTGREPRR